MRDLWVDYAKAIGIILVVYGHVARGLFKANIAMNDSAYRIIDSFIYSFHIPLFFFLSGLFFCESLQKRGWRSLIANKIDTIVYPYIIWSILQGSIEVLLNRWTNGNTNFSQVLSLFWVPRAQFWFLYALFFVIITGTLIYTKADKKYFLLIAFLASVAYLIKNTFAVFPAIGYVFSYFCFFAIGAFFKEVQHYFYNSRQKLLLPSFALFAGAQYLFHCQYGLNYTIGGLPTLVVALISIIFIVTLCMCISNKSVSILSLIGASSMQIYLAHILAASGTRIIMSKFLHINDLYTILFLGCFLGILFPIIALKISSRLGLSFIFSIPSKFSIEKAYNNSICRSN